MAGTVEGGKRTAETNKRLYGDDFYNIIGRKGGRASKGGPFEDRDFAAEMGALGGKKSKRGPSRPTTRTDDHEPSLT